MTESLQSSNETGVALCNGVYASESNTCDDNSTSCKNAKLKATLAKEVRGIFLNQLLPEFQVCTESTLPYKLFESITKFSTTGRSVEL